MNIYTILDDRKSIASTLNNLAREERYQGNYLTALDYSIRGLEIQKTLGDPKALAKALLGAGIIYRLVGRYEESLNHIHKAHLYYKKTNNINGMVDTSNQMGLIYIRLKKFDQARSFYQLTIELPEDKVIPKNLAAAYREMAVIDLEAGNYKSAKEMANKAHNIYQAQHDKLKSSISARIIGDIYRAQGENTQAIIYYRDSLSFANEIGSIIYQIKAQTRLAGVLMDKDVNEAISLLKKSLELAIQIDMKPEKLYAYTALRQAEKSQGNFIDSLHYAEEEIALSKIIAKEHEENELVQTKAYLDSRKIEMELESLKENAKLVQLELIKKNSEMEIATQASKISELELTKNKYASMALVFLLMICSSAVIYIYRRFVDSRKQNKELNYLAARDPLTNCFNRRILFELMNRDFKNKAQLGEYCIILADIDHFKKVNDTHGHIAGDSVLRDVANILQKGVRQNDITARFGGEEFCLILPSAAQEQAIRIAETLRQKIEASSFNGMNVTCSFGVTSIHFNAQTPKELISQADSALYQSKASGRNKVTLWGQY